MGKRYLESYVLEDLQKKMVFISGPRQVGKTTFAKKMATEYFSQFEYYNWDQLGARRELLKEGFKPSSELILLDEIHKYRQWKNWLKGEYDVYHEKHKFLITGSASLDIYRKGGDSMLGRYHHFRLHPFSVRELLDDLILPKPFEELPFSPSMKASEACRSLLQFGGFPEPFFAQSELTLRRWHSSRLERLVQQDIRDVELLRDLTALEQLADLLPTKVGSKLSINSLREDFFVSHQTMTHWLDVLEQFYYHYRLYPFHSKKINALKKEPKLYLWDWSLNKDPGARLENMVASHLLKFVHILKDAEGWKAELWYLRDIDGHEVDFLLTVDSKPWFAVEVKTGQKEPSKTLSYYGDRLKIPFLYQVVDLPNVDFLKNKVRVMSADHFLSGLV